MSEPRHLITEPHDGHPDTETCPGCPHGERVRTWDHRRKGRIRGVVVDETGDWLDIRLVGDHQIGYVSRTIDPHADGGEILTVRKSLLTEVADA